MIITYHHYSKLTFSMSNLEIVKPRDYSRFVFSFSSAYVTFCDHRNNSQEVFARCSHVTTQISVSFLAQLEASPSTDILPPSNTRLIRL